MIQTGNFGCASGATFGGSFQTRGHIRAIAGWEFTPRFMGFLAGGLAIGELGPGGIQVGGIIVDNPSPVSAGSVTSTYGRRTLYGYSWGGGVQAKLNESLVGRLEYLRDEYAGPGQTSVVSTNTSGSGIITATSNPQNMRITNETLRASLIYRFDPNVPFYEAAQRDFAQFGRWQGSGNAFAGFYAGVGLSQNNYDYRMTNNRTLTINNSTTPGVDISERTDTALDGAQNAKNFLLGYRFQAGRLVVGAEREFVQGSYKNLARPGFELGFAGWNRDLPCYEQFAPNIVCVGLITTRGAVETRGRFRAVTGVEITPSLLAFVGYGRAYGRAEGTSGSSQGIVAVPPSSPLVGAATVSRAQSNDISGHTFGGGVEYKAMDNLMFRVDYWRDHYIWNAIVCGGAGFGGTIGTITVNSFASCSTPSRSGTKPSRHRSSTSSGIAGDRRLCRWRFAAACVGRRRRLTAGRVRKGGPGVQGAPGRGPGGVCLDRLLRRCPCRLGLGPSKTGPASKEAFSPKAASMPKAGSPARKLATTIRSTSGCSASSWTAISPTWSASA